MKTLAIDIETYSSVDIKESGVYAYSHSPDFSILMCAYAFDDEEVQLIDFEYELKSLIDNLVEVKGVSREQAIWEVLPKEFRDALISPAIIKTAYNANFERTCLAKFIGLLMPPEQWRCTAVHASTLGLPGNLSSVGEVLDLSEDKQKTKIGKSLIQYFSIPCKPTKKNNGRTRNLPTHDMEKWELFKAYCKQDVVTEREIRKIIERFPILEREQALWCLDQKINDRGIELDMELVHTIIEYDKDYQEGLSDEAQRLTGLENPNSATQLKGWLADMGYPVDSINKDAVSSLIKDTEDEKIKRVLELRQEMAKTSTKKYLTMERAVCPDSRIRGVLQFYGANRTGRWAGRLVQVQNLPQNKIADLELAREVVKNKEWEALELLFEGAPFIFSQLIRTAFVAKKDHRFVVSDFSAIEARVIAWLADEQWRLDVFNTHGKIYEASASQMFHVPLESIKKGSKLRQQGKIAELALGYGGGIGAIKVMDKNGDIPENEIGLLVRNWRAANPNIVKFWNKCEAAAKACIRERRSIKIQHGLVFSFEEGILFIQLPSGRRLAYYNARIGETQNRKAEIIKYSGVDQTKKIWCDLETYGGKIVENIVQAVARDCLAVTMMRVDKAGYETVMHIHDELVIEVPNTDTTANEKITDIFGTPISWAEGLPLKGDTYETPFYKKD